MSSEAPSEHVQATLQQARRELLGGRGPGASAEEIAAHTRNRVVIAGETATRRLELAARDTVRARRDPDGLTDTIAVASTELVDNLAELTERLRPSRLVSAAARAAIARAPATPVFLLVGAAIIVLVRRRHSHEGRAPTTRSRSRR